MKKFFSFVLMVMLCTVMAWSATRTAGTFDELQSAITSAAAGDVIELTANIAYPASPTRTDLINIDKSITLDGKGYAITGCGFCNYRVDGKATYQPTHIAINANRDKSDLNVVIKNLKLDKDFKKYALNGLDEEAVSGCPTSSERYFGVGVFDGVSSLLLEKDTFTTSKGGNAQIICVQGTSSTPLELTINESYLNATQGSGYPTYFLKPVDLEINNCIIEGYCGLYFKPDLAPFSTSNYPRAYWYGTGNYGSTGSEVVANNTLFVSKNPHDTGDNDFGILAMEEGGINITLNNCGLDAEALKSVSQCLFLLSSWAPLENRATNNVLTITGDNSHINGSLIDATWYAIKQDNGASTLYENGYDSKAGKACDPFSAFTGDIQIIIEGGTYNFNPKTYQYNMHVSTDDPHYADGTAAPTVFTKKGVKIPDGYDVSEIKQGDVTLYRVVKKAATYTDPVTSKETLYDLNDAVETAAEGENPVTSFELSTGGTMELDEDREVTTAGYVQVKDNEDTGNATVVKVGTTDAGDNKVDQTLFINNGLDVQGDSKVEVQAGSALVIGEGGINTEKPENIVIEADENGAATLLLDPTITVNQTPELTVKMMAKLVGYKPKTNDPSKNDYYWHRFAMPVDQITELPRTPNVGTSIKYWDYTIGEEGDWASIPALTAMEPFNGYTLCPASAPQDVEYTFQGKLVGNTNNPLNFTTKGFNFFGNSYTGYISLIQLVDMITNDTKLEGTVWVWAPGQIYESVSLTMLRDYPSTFPAYKREIAPMQTFVLYVKSDDMPDMEINYASAIWGNPRYDAILRPSSGSSPAPHREELTAPMMSVEISAASGKKDVVMFVEKESFSDDFDNGYDASKFMNAGVINAYSTIEGKDLSIIATNNLEGKTISLNTNDEIAYTLSFTHVVGEDYALEDVATGKVIAVEEGATYEFAAQPNSTVANRFRIVGRHNVPTSVETTEAQNAAKGIYTILGQYVGEDFSTLPAGVYVVDGVKIVK